VLDLKKLTPVIDEMKETLNIDHKDI
jgi:hypothetical protein